MSIEEVIKKINIPFPKPQSLEQVEELLRYITMNLPATIRCHFQYNTYFSKGKDSKLLEDNGSVNIIASIVDTEKTMAIGTLESRPYSQDSSYISALAFQMVPGWDISDYRPEVLNLWDEVRGLTKKHFSEKR